MNDVKWIKIKVGMFDGNSFKRIKRARIDGVINFRDKLTAVWFELLDLGGKINNSGFLINEEIAFRNYEDISIALDREEAEIKMCIEWYVNNGMMEIVDSIFLISNWIKYQNDDGLKKIQEQNAERQRRYKEKQKQQLLEITPKEEDNVIVTLPVTLGNASPLILNSNSISNSSISNTKYNVEEAFERFWNIYPRKEAKSKSKEWFAKNKPNEETLNKIVESIGKFKQTRQWETKEFIPHPTTWLNQKRWEDELEVNNNQKNEKYGNKKVVGVPDWYADYENDLKLGQAPKKRENDKNLEELAKEIFK